MSISCQVELKKLTQKSTINPHISFAPLPISETILRMLFTKLSVFPPFLEVVRLFGEKVQQSNEDFSVFRHQVTLDKERTTVKAYGFRLPFLFSPSP